MRFDGYYILSDWWGIDNLQQRSFQLAQWKLRQFLFGAIEEKPEFFFPDLEFKLICYAWLTWFYRLILFLAIALLVYHFFFKLLGIILFFVEIVMLILLPIGKEVVRWWSLKDKINLNGRTGSWAILLIITFGLLFYPWNSHIYIPGILTSANYASIFSSESAQIVSIDVNRGQKVENGQVLMVLRSPKIETEIKIARNQIEYFKLRAQRIVTNRQDKEDLHVIMEQIAAESSRLEGLEKRQARLILRAPISGVLAEMEEKLKINQWINDSKPLFFIMDPEVPEIKGVAFEHVINRIEKGQNALFYPEDPLLPRLNASINRIDRGNIKDLDLDYLSYKYGGEVAVKSHNDEIFVPENTAYAIYLSNVSSDVINQEIRGAIYIKGEPISIFEKVYEIVASVLIRESGF